MPNLVLASGHFDPRARERSSGDGLNGLSSPEIAQLVSAALENALLALGDEDPSEFLQLRAVDSRREMRQTLRSLPQAEAECPTVQADYRKAVVFQNVALNLAFEIMHAIDRYARAVDVAAEPRDR